MNIILQSTNKSLIIHLYQCLLTFLNVSLKRLLLIMFHHYLLKLIITLSLTMLFNQKKIYIFIILIHYLLKNLDFILKILIHLEIQNLFIIEPHYLLSQLSHLLHIFFYQLPTNIILINLFYRTLIQVLIQQQIHQYKVLETVQYKINNNPKTYY